MTTDDESNARDLPVQRMIDDAHAALKRHGVSDAGDLACHVLALADALDEARRENAMRLRDCGRLDATWERDKARVRRMESGLIRLADRCEGYTPEDVRADVADALGIEVADL